MATATDDAYTSSTGQGIFGGRELPPFELTGNGADFGDSLTDLGYGVQPAIWGMPLSRHPAKIVVNHGHPNDTLEDMLARQAAAIADMLAAGCEFVVCRMGTNGAGSGDFEDDYTELVDAFHAAGLKTVLLQIPPTATSGAPLVALNDFIEALAASRPTMAVYVADGDAIADSDYAALPGMLSDGIHYAPLGQYTSGDAEAGPFATIFPTDPRLTDEGDIPDQWVVNPLCEGTGGTVGGSGTAPDGWEISSSGGTVSASIQAAGGSDPVQAPWTRMRPLTSSGTGNTYTADLDMVHPAIDADFDEIALFEAVCECRMNIDTADLDKMIFTLVDSGNSDAAIGYVYHMPFPGTAIDRILVLRNSLRRVLNNAYAANKLKLRMQIVTATSFASSPGYIDLRCAWACGLAS